MKIGPPVRILEIEPIEAPLPGGPDEVPDAPAPTPEPSTPEPDPAGRPDG